MFGCTTAAKSSPRSCLKQDVDQAAADLTALIKQQSSTSTDLPASTGSSHRPPASNGVGAGLPARVTDRTIAKKKKKKKKEWQEMEDYCNKCQTPFSTFVRRHDCHICHETYCAWCSTHSLKVVDKDGKLSTHRVCSTCKERGTDAHGFLRYKSRIKANAKAKIGNSRGFSLFCCPVHLDLDESGSYTISVLIRGTCDRSHSCKNLKASDFSNLRKKLFAILNNNSPMVAQLHSFDLSPPGLLKPLSESMTSCLTFIELLLQSSELCDHEVLFCFFFFFTHTHVLCCPEACV